MLDPEKYSPGEIARRERLLEQTIAELRAPLHPNCYLSPIQFAEKFGLASPATGSTETTESAATEAEKHEAPAPTVSNAAKDAQSLRGTCRCVAGKVRSIGQW